MKNWSGLGSVILCALLSAACSGTPNTSGGCGDVMSSPANCGACGTVCSSQNVAAPACTAGVCTGACAAGFADCNKNLQSDGCEVATATDVNNCGGCGVTCSGKNLASSTCSAGVCGGACSAGFADCNLDKARDGCETAIDSDPQNCGGCGAACSGSNVMNVACQAGACTGTCAAGFKDCNNNLQTDGCEIDTTKDVKNCGGCGAVCSGSNVMNVACQAGICTGTCATGFKDCNNNLQTDGCEIDTTKDVKNCGGCGAVCSGSNVMNVACQAGACTGTCATGFKDCNNNLQTDGCETSVTTVNNCGACGVKCAAGGVCSAGSCAYATSCKALLAANPGLASGVYTISPTGVATPFQVYCDMTTGGGGWTLVLKQDGNLATLAYDAALWTNTATYNPTQPGFDTTEAKLQSFSTVPFTQISVGMKIGATVTYLTINQTSTSLYDLLKAGAYVASSLGRAAWKGLVPGASLQPNCNQEGFNVNPAAGMRARIGVVSNQEDDCLTPDSYIGIGGAGGGQCISSGQLAAEASCGDVACYTPDNGNVNLPAFGYVFVR